jgi:hypothetical protein
VERDQPHAAWAALFYSCAPRFDYWLRHMPPNETVQHAAVFDHAMLQAAEQLGYVGMLHDVLTRGAASTCRRACVVAASARARG